MLMLQVRKVEGWLGTLVMCKIDCVKDDGVREVSAKMDVL